MGPIRAVERPNSRLFRLSSGYDSALPGSPYDGQAIGFHNYTPRFWRRLYGEVWQLTSVMERKSGGPLNGWDTTWGGTPLRPISPSTSSFEFFEGVDSKGALLGLPDEQPPRTRRIEKNHERGEQ